MKSNHIPTAVSTSIERKALFSRKRIMHFFTKHQISAKWLDDGSLKCRFSNINSSPAPFFVSFEKKGVIRVVSGSMETHNEIGTLFLLNGYEVSVFYECNFYVVKPKASVAQKHKWKTKDQDIAA